MVQVAVGLVRSILLTRLVPVQAFGIYAFAGSIVSLTKVLPNFGMVAALVHRSPETADEDLAAGVHFTLQSIFSAVWVAGLVAAAFIFSEGQNRIALLALATLTAATSLTQPAQAILIRRVEHRRLALLQLTDILVSATAAILFAWRGIGLWALLITDVVTFATSYLFLYLWRPAWRPKLKWVPPIIRYFLRYGIRNVTAQGLLQALNEVDDLWTGAFLGNVALGFYSRAYAFATYPRMILATAVNKVAGGTYAELKGQRKRLSQAFFRANALLIRSGFLLAGLLFATAPELVTVMLGKEWLPMLDAFRLMLVFTLLDPIKITVSDLFLAIGLPGDVVRVRAIQLVVLILTLFALGPSLGIMGVAIAVDSMLLVGMAILLVRAREHVDFSARRLFLAPVLGLALGLWLSLAATNIQAVAASDWLMGVIKAAIFATVFGAVLLATERREILTMIGFVIQQVSGSSRGRPKN
jgi:O-antigen/teichoic acid export membrane protein